MTTRRRRIRIGRRIGIMIRRGRIRRRKTRKRRRKKGSKRRRRKMVLSNGNNNDNDCNQINTCNKTYG